MRPRESHFRGETTGKAMKTAALTYYLARATHILKTAENTGKTIENAKNACLAFVLLSYAEIRLPARTPPIQPSLKFDEESENGLHFALRGVLVYIHNSGVTCSLRANKAWFLILIFGAGPLHNTQHKTPQQPTKNWPIDLFLTGFEVFIHFLTKKSIRKSRWN